MTTLKGITPTPAQAAQAYADRFGAVIDSAGGKDGRISRASAERLAERGDAGALVSDNLVNYLDATGQKSVSANKFKAVVQDYVAATASAAAGANQKLSLLEIRNLPADLQADLKHLRGKDDLALFPTVTFDENFLYPFLQTWTATASVDGGFVSRDSTGTQFSGLPDMGPWQGVAEDALDHIWDNVLIYRSWPEGSPVELGRNRAGTLDIGEAIDEATGKPGLLVHWKDIDDASFAWFYEKKDDGTYTRGPDVFLN